MASRLLGEARAAQVGLDQQHPRPGGGLDPGQVPGQGRLPLARDRRGHDQRAGALELELAAEVDPDRPERVGLGRRQGAGAAPRAGQRPAARDPADDRAAEHVLHESRVADPAVAALERDRQGEAEGEADDRPDQGVLDRLRRGGLGRGLGAVDLGDRARAVRRRELEVLKLGLQRLALAAGELGLAQPGEPLLDRLRFALEPLAVVLLAEVDELLRVDVRDLRGLLRARRNDGHRREVRLGLRDHVHLGVQLTTKSCLHSIREGRELQEPNVGRGLALGLGGSEHRAGVAEQERGLRPVLLVLKKRERERGGLNEHQRQQDREPAPTQESPHAGGLRDLSITAHRRAVPAHGIVRCHIRVTTHGKENSRRDVSFQGATTQLHSGGCSDAPEVSVCIPAYEAEGWIEPAVRSALEQTHGDLEVVVVDNDSTDGTVARVSALALEDPRVRLYANSRNLGVYRNFNRALALSRGRYIKFLCADDVLEPDCVERMLRPFALSPRVGLCFAPRAIVLEDPADARRSAVEGQARAHSRALRRAARDQQRPRPARGVARRPPRRQLDRGTQQRDDEPGVPRQGGRVPAHDARQRRHGPLAPRHARSRCRVRRSPPDTPAGAFSVAWDREPRDQQALARRGVDARGPALVRRGAALSEAPPAPSPRDRPRRPQRRCPQKGPGCAASSPGPESTRTSGSGATAIDPGSTARSTIASPPARPSRSARQDRSHAGGASGLASAGRSRSGSGSAP